LDSFHYGLGDEQTHVAEGLAFALEAFKDLQLRRKQKYNIFLEF
jgi:hypothetical protein